MPGHAPIVEAYTSTPRLSVPRTILTLRSALISAAWLIRVYVAVVRSGGIHIGVGRLGPSGTNGYSWSSWSVKDDTNAYYLDFDGNNVYPSNANPRWLGFPLRCLAK